MSQWRLILLVFFSPGKGFRRLVEQPRALLALGLIIASALAAHAAISSRLDVEAMSRLTSDRLASQASAGELSESEIEKQTVLALNMHRISGYALWATLPFLLAFVLAFLYWMLGKLSSSGIRLGTGYALAACVWLPFGLRCLMSVPVVFSYPGVDPAQTRGLFRTDLASLLGPGLAFPGAAWLDPYWIWMAVLFALAGRAAGWGRLTAVVGGGLVWLILGFAGRLLT